MAVFQEYANHVTGLGMASSLGERKAHQNRMVNGVCIVARPKTGLDETKRPVKGYCRVV